VLTNRNAEIWHVLHRCHELHYDMNIFVLDNDPVNAAKYLCDKHVCKMLLESAQVLCTVFHLKGSNAQYRATHVKHPCVLWTMASKGNFDWLVEHARGIAIEKRFRYGTKHASEDVVELCANASSNLTFERTSMTPFVQAMPETYKDVDAVKAYRAYYVGEKIRFAKWNKGRERPEWFI